MGCRFEGDAGASPHFPPQHPTPEAAQAELEQLVQRDPHQLGLAQTRWTLASVGQQCAWLRSCSVGGIHGILKRLQVVWKRARSSIRSPDPNYADKLKHIHLLRSHAHTRTDDVVTYLDEITIERQPTLTNAYAPLGTAQARARRSHTSNTLTRVVAALNAHTGQVTYQLASKISLPTLVTFYQALRDTYPHARTIYVIQDNWPVHTHPDVLVALQPQTSRWPWHRPANWPSIASPRATARFGSLHLPIQIVPLPTYASWTNPIEKLWRKLRQDVTHLHPWANDLPLLRTQLARFLDQFASGSDDLLRYVGLSTGFIF